MRKLLVGVLAIMFVMSTLLTATSYANNQDQGLTFYNFKTNKNVYLKEPPNTDKECLEYMPQHEACFSLYFAFRAQGHSPQESLILTLKEIAKAMREQQGGRCI